MGGQSHTAGPWVSERTVDEWGLSVIASDDSDVISNPSRGAVCHVSVVAGASGDEPETARANARLIAAAPELLEALKPFAAVLADVGSDEDDQDLYSAMSRAHRTVPALTIGHLRAAFSAIAKATGAVE